MEYKKFKTEIFAKNPDVKEAYDKLGPQYEEIRAEIESGNYDPSLAFCKRWYKVLAKQ